MYAVIRTGGKQYKVSAGDVLAVEKLTAEPGTNVTFSEVLMIGDEAGQTVGTPLVPGVTVTAEVMEQGRGDKLIVFKKKRRKHYRRMTGHRQYLTTLKITDVAGKGIEKKAAKPAGAAADKAAATEATADKAAEKTDAKPATPRQTAGTGAGKKATAKTTAPKPAAKKSAAKKSAAKKAGGKADDGN